MTKEEFYEEVCDTDSLYTFCNENGYYSYTDELYSSDSYNDYLDEHFSEMMRHNGWKDVRYEMNNVEDPDDSYWWYCDEYGDFRPADDDWFTNTREELLEELEGDGFFEEEEEDEEDEPDFEVENASIFFIA